MLLLILGVLLWALSHVFKRVAPARRAAMGDPGKGAVALGIAAGLVLMILGYRMAGTVFVWAPPAFLTHLNNLLMLIAVFLFALSQSKGALKAKIGLRHPQLLSVCTWAVAHLMVNGDLASLILFGGLLAWALVEMALINRAESWTRPTPGPWARDAITIGATLVAFFVITLIHGWIGPSPFSA